jgi:hypothetical protein
VGLEQGPLSLMSITEELLWRNNSVSGLENREYGRGDPLRSPRDTLFPKKLALISPKCGGRSVGIVRLRIKPLSLFVLFCLSDRYNSMLHNLRVWKSSWNMKLETWNYEL